MPLHMLFILTANKLKGKGGKNIKLRNKITLYLPIKHIKQLTGVPAVTGNPRHNKQHETGFNNMFHRTFTLPACENSRQL